MLLALNIGNTNVTFGGYDSAGQRVFASRFYSDSALSSDELVYKLVNMLALYHIQPRDVDAAILASVVPVLTSRMREALEKMTNAPLMEVGPGLKSGVRIRMDNPAQLGGELLCAAVGALQTHKPSGHEHGYRRHAGCRGCRGQHCGRCDSAQPGAKPFGPGTQHSPTAAD